MKDWYMSTTQKTLIDNAHLEATLNAMIYSNANTTALYDFAELPFIQKHIQYLDKTIFDPAIAIEYIIQNILAQLMEKHLNQLRLALFYSLPATITYHQAKEIIERDAQTNSQEIIGFSFLYHFLSAQI